MQRLKFFAKKNSKARDVISVENPEHGTSTEPKKPHISKEDTGVRTKAEVQRLLILKTEKKWLAKHRPEKQT